MHEVAYITESLQIPTPISPDSASWRQASCVATSDCSHIQCGNSAFNKNPLGITSEGATDTCAPSKGGTSTTTHHARIYRSVS